AVRAGHERHVHALGEVDFVWVNLRKDGLLRQTHIIVAVAIEALRIDPAEVADTRQGNANQAIQKLVHTLAAQRDAATDGVALAEAKAADRNARQGDL